MSEQVLLTQSALGKLKEDLHQLKTMRRKEIAEKIYIAKEMGDLSENAEYAEAKDEQGFLEAKISEMEYKIKTATIVDSKDDGMVNLGCVVKIIGDGDVEQTFTIVSFNEADPTSGKISNASPIGSALLGEKEGSEVDVELPSGVKKFKIISIKC